MHDAADDDAEDLPEGDATTWARYTLEGDIDLHTSDGDLHFTRAEVVAQGSFAAPEGRLRLELDTTMGELRKLARAHAGLAELLADTAHIEDDHAVSLVLVAHPAHQERLATRARDEDGEDLSELAGSSEWLGAIFDLDAYDTETVGTLHRDGGVQA